MAVALDQRYRFLLVRWSYISNFLFTVISVFSSFNPFNFLTDIDLFSYIKPGQMHEMPSWVRKIWKHHGSHLGDTWLGWILGGCTHPIHCCRGFRWREHVQMWKVCFYPCQLLLSPCILKYGMPWSCSIKWCFRCSTYVNARKQLSIHEVPNILTVVLKRFQVTIYCWVSI